MAEYDNARFVKDFVNRTKVNLKAIDNLHDFDEKEVYEVTQYINSLFGLVIVPFDRYRDKLEECSKNINGYKKVYKAINNIKQIGSTYPSDYDQCNGFKVFYFIKHLRNSLAHLGNSRILFLYELGQIEGIIIYDECNYKDNEGNEISYKFCAQMSLDTLKELVNGIQEIYSYYIEEDDEFDYDYANEITAKQNIIVDLKK